MPMTKLMARSILHPKGPIGPSIWVGMTGVSHQHIVANKSLNLGWTRNERGGR